MWLDVCLWETELWVKKVCIDGECKDVLNSYAPLTLFECDHVDIENHKVVAGELGEGGMEDVYFEKIWRSSVRKWIQNGSCVNA